MAGIENDSDDPTVVRRPVRFGGINDDIMSPTSSEDSTALLSRYRYYSRLDPRQNSTLVMPNHVVPAEYFVIIPIKVELGRQSSIITIFSIWNTMLGTSVLAMPWALEKAGFATGLSILIIMAALMLYMAYRVMKSPNNCGPASGSFEFSDVCRYYLGRWGEYVSVLASILSLLGATIVYWVLMSSFLYNVVVFIYDVAFDLIKPNATAVDIHYPDVLCPNGNGSSSDNATETSTFDTVWNQYKTVPLFLMVLIVPLINFRSPTFFTKFNTLGTISILYIFIFVFYKSASWGVHAEFSLNATTSSDFIPQFQWTFPVLTGVLSQSYMIHNCIISIVKNQRYPEHNARDLSIAFMLVASTYIAIAAVFYVCFPLPKHCIFDNILENFKHTDGWAIFARGFLLFQMLTVFPLLTYIMRSQLFKTVFGVEDKGLLYIFGFNGIVVTICILFATFLPSIGSIIRFVGAFSGFIYVFTLPGVIYMMQRREDNALTWQIIVFHGAIIAFGLANFVAQIVIKG